MKSAGWAAVAGGVAAVVVLPAALLGVVVLSLTSGGSCAGDGGPGGGSPQFADGAWSAWSTEQLTGCVDQGGSNLAAAPTGLPPDFTLPADPQQQVAVAYALAQVGKPYAWGAKGPDAFDCSGLMQAAWAAAGVNISAGTVNQVHDGTAVGNLGQAQPGDLLFIPGSFGTPSTPRHVGMYAGHGIVVNAYDAATGVITESVASWAPQIVAIRRIASSTDDPGSPST